MKYGLNYGDKYTTKYTNPFTGEEREREETYRYTEYGRYHTNNLGNGLWFDDKQIIGTCDFSVAGCSTEKSAKAKIRRWTRCE